MSTIGFTEDHEWVRLEGDIATCGITEYAQDQLGDVVSLNCRRSGERWSRATRRRWSNR